MAGLPRAARTARRLWPVALALYRRWDSLSPEEKERYLRVVRENAQRSRAAAVRSAQVARENAQRSGEAAARSAQAARERLRRTRGR